MYEFVARHLPQSLLLRTGVSLVAVLAFDTVLFVTGCFVESPAYGSILLSGLLGKTVTGIVYAVLLTVYLRHLDVAEPGQLGVRWRLGDLLQVLTYRQKYEVLRAQMTRDALTGVYNRAFFDETLSTLLARSLRTGIPVTLMMIDVDHFKQINDTYGHREGDHALEAIASIIVGSIRASDVACRYGGEEFAVLLPDTALEPGIRLAERIRRAVPSGLPRCGARWSEPPVTVTIGLATAPSEATTADDLIQLADRRLYDGKAHGRNRVAPGKPDPEDVLAHPERSTVER